MPTKADHFQLVENYANHIIDGMDTDSLANMVFDLLVREYEKLSWDDITEEIVDIYDEDTLIDLIGDADDNNTDEPSEATGWWQLH
mgnify:CR=1 FL=1